MSRRHETATWEEFEKFFFFLSRFINEMTHYVQVTDRETLSALQGGLTMNTLF